MTNYYDALSPENTTVFSEEITKILEREFKVKTEIESRPGFGSQVFHYPKGEAVISRLNEAFGSCWSFVIKEYFKDEEDSNTVIVLGELVVNMPGFPMRIIQQFAGKTIAKRSGKAINIANDYKSAASLSLRKCAMQLGVGLYLQKGLPDEDLMEADEENHEEKSATKNETAKSQEKAPAKTNSYASNSSKPASAAQKNFVKSLYVKKGITEEVDFDNLTSTMASEYIKNWKEMPDANSSGPEKTPETKSASTAKKAEVKFSPEAEENLTKLRTISASLVGVEDITAPKVDKFILHIYKTNFSKELSSITEMKEEELAKLLADIEDDE